MKTVRTRFAPSPTGFLHIGSLRTALYAYALAKHSSGDFILRIEDTDRKREVKGATEALQATLKKFGLVWDEFYVQSDRSREGIYKKAAEKLVSEGHAFYCQCKAKNAKEEGFSNELRDPCREKKLVSGAIKLRVPDGRILSYRDFVHKKEISWNSDDVYDATLLKSDGFPTYHLAAMTDDIQMEVSHILRGHDWLPSTPIHLLVFEYLGGKRPEIGHLTDILSAQTGKKLSKRRDSVFAEQFLTEGYLPEALLNFVMLLGWAPKDNSELFSLDEFVKAFDINGFQEANPKFFTDKLNWFNQQYLHKKFEGNLKGFLDYVSDISSHRDQKDFVRIAGETSQFMLSRMANIKDYDEMTGFFYSRPQVDKKLLGKNYKEHIKIASEIIENIKPWKLETLNEGLMNEIRKRSFKVGEFFMDLRIAITGSKYTPPINDSIIVLGKDETLKRLSDVI